MDEGFGADDMFSSFLGGGGGMFNLFGGAGGRGQRRRKVAKKSKRFYNKHLKGEDTVQPLAVSLEDLYKGKTTKLKLTKKIICGDCSGYVF